MKKHKFTYAILSALLTVSFLTAPAMAQRGSVKTDTRILYHNGPVMIGTTNVYLIWYGNWTGVGATTTAILTDLVGGLGATPYFLINTTYPNAAGDAPSGALVYAGTVYDAYSQGPTLSVESIQQIVADQIASGSVPLDPSGVYLVFGSADVTDVRPDGSTFCTPGTSPHHGAALFNGTTYKYGYVGAANRCPTTAGAQFIAPDGTMLPTPNGDFAADAMANSVARLLNVSVTNPLGTGAEYAGWFDRYGLENADKCAGKFGTTFTTANGARANMRFGQRAFLIQENWVNDRRGRCSLSYQ